MIFVISLSLQVAAGVILLLWSFGKRDQLVIQQYYPGSNIATRDKNNNVVLKKEKLQKAYQRIVMSNWSFSDLVLGYLLSVFAEKRGSNWALFMLILIVSALIVACELWLSGIVSRKKYPQDLVIPFSALEDQGLEVETIITAEEIDRMFESRQ